MDAQTLDNLTPASDTSTAIREAISRAAEAREASVAKAAALNTRLVAEALTLTSAARKTIRGELDDCVDDMVQLDAIVAQLEDKLETALSAERVAAEENAHAELLAKIARDEAEWSKAYPQIARNLRRLVDARLALVSEVFRHNQTLGESRPSLFIAGLDELKQPAEEVHCPISDAERQFDIRQDREFFSRVESGNYRVAAWRARKENRRVPLELILAFRRER